MSSQKLNKTDIPIVLNGGLSSNVNSLATRNMAITGELFRTTDTNKVYMFDGSNNARVHGLDLAVTFENEVICYNNEIICLT